jgi:hypothetical protein
MRVLARLFTAEARVAELERLLQPMKRMAKYADDYHADDDLYACALPNCGPGIEPLTVGELRAAARALEGRTDGTL